MTLLAWCKNNPSSFLVFCFTFQCLASQRVSMTLLARSNTFLQIITFSRLSTSKECCSLWEVSLVKDRCFSRVNSVQTLYGSLVFISGGGGDGGSVPSSPSAPSTPSSYSSSRANVIKNPRANSLFPPSRFSWSSCHLVVSRESGLLPQLGMYAAARLRRWSQGESTKGLRAPEILELQRRVLNT